MLTLCIAAFAAEEPEEVTLLGDESDGSLTPPTHLIPLYAEDEFGEKGEQITPDMDLILPFSTRFTCGECHSYDVIKMGWHFNAIDSNAPAGREGEPWIYFESKYCLQIPLSYRDWQGTYKPEQIGLTEFGFTKVFGRSIPGGGTGEVKATLMADITQKLVSGNLEINCLACHNAHYGQNMGGLSGYSVQVSTKNNFRWAAAASSEIATVSGNASLMDIMYDPFMPDPDMEDAPTVTYREDAFDDNNEVLLNIVREVPNERCYYCHSELHQTINEKTEKWTQDVDIHLTAGLSCVDCHRNGIEHNIVRGYDSEEDISDNPMTSTSTCESCHIASEGHYEEALAGRLGAPIPTHPGIPAVHFDKLTCTACHSGPWPERETILSKTSRSHRLGTPNVDKSPQILPHVVSPVLARITHDGSEDEDAKIAPYRALWPSFWGTIEDGNVAPVTLDVVTKSVGSVFDDLELAYSEGWPEVTDEIITNALTALNDNTSIDSNTVAAYIGSGKLYSLDEEGQLTEEQEHPAAQPYLWSIGHNVRPAAQALGVRYCTDCHSTDAGFFFGDVRVDTPVVDDRGIFKKMLEFQDARPFYTWAFAASFVFRPWLKILAIGSCVILAGVILVYALRALSHVIDVLSGGK
ncbi:hypothetical protein ACFLZ8_00390 [Planctomycetota bacterium]